MCETASAFENQSIQPINRLPNKSRVTVCKYSIKTPSPLMIQTLRKLAIEGNFLNLTKCICEEAAADPLADQAPPQALPPALPVMDRPPSPHPPVASPPRRSRSAPTRCRVHFGEDGEVDDPRSEVEGCLLAVVDHRDAVAVPIAGPRHATLEDGEGQPAGTGEQGAGLGLPPGPGELAARTSPGLASVQTLVSGERPHKVPSRGWGRPPPPPDCSGPGELGWRPGPAGCGRGVSATGLQPELPRFLLFHRAPPA